jgi:hypothetical protein
LAKLTDGFFKLPTRAGDLVCAPPLCTLVAR